MIFNINFALHNHKSKIHGIGCFAVNNIPAKRKIGSLGGELISFRAGRKKIKNIKGPIHMVDLPHINKCLDASINSNQLKYVNHSCKPNTFIKIRGVHVEIYALRNIEAGEELTANYGETHHDGKLKCNCGVKGCIAYL